ncbi:thiamine pyrophosphate-binding protein [Prochlorothrix hollandica]|uniref:thiamine pyrophosphate-binding protein n=1 Tax=Prochlorothrix hollandica TaxID=1223 RepID=UPI0033421997
MTQTAPVSSPQAADPSPRTMSDLLVDYLELFGVEHVFGVPGGHITRLYEALAISEQRGGPRSIITRHETGAMFMAAGYARETGKLGACCATTGPGASNLVTGVVTSSADHCPVLIISGQSALKFAGRGALQESSPHLRYPDNADSLSMLHSCTRYSDLVSNADQLEHKLAAALTAAMRPLRGPVHLSIPPEVLNAPAPDAIAYPNLANLLMAPHSFVDQVALDKLWERLQTVLGAGQKVVIYVGHECGPVREELAAFATLIDAALITTQRGKTWVDPYHPQSRGVFGGWGHSTAREALSDPAVGLILAVGTAMGQLATALWDPVLLNDRLVHIHHADTYFARTPMAAIQVCGTLSRVFATLIDRVKAQYHHSLEATTPPPNGHAVPHGYPPAQITIKGLEAYDSEAVPLKPQRLVRELSDRCPPATRFVIDNGNCLSWSVHFMFSRQMENYRWSLGQPSMGWAVGTAVGVALALPKTPVVCLVGDGSYLMYGQEITVAVEEGLPVIFVLLNDQAYGMIKHRHRQTSKHPQDYLIRTPIDFALMAQAVGAQSYTVRTAQELISLDYGEMCSRSGPTLLDVYIDPEEAPPLGVA